MSPTKLLSRVQSANARIAQAVRAGDAQAEAEARRDQAYAKLVYEIDTRLDGVTLTSDQRRSLTSMINGQLP
ncbi:hypothetical protein SEA_FUZZBUSTER_82 [Microbacterium phage FuzzBuster]|uniref:Uncharacterized protein n=1 Tax=Microbacterium phage FuzzBuster TaxID=2590935 RepID=A0A516KV56_9CAUD|nr:hypothetical protein SEA_FUZZBUSTER_82 [Microbacterium phage FuzzBuster]